jgi:putative heme transporter
MIGRIRRPAHTNWVDALEPDRFEVFGASLTGSGARFARVRAGWLDAPLGAVPGPPMAAQGGCLAQGSQPTHDAGTTSPPSGPIARRSTSTGRLRSQWTIWRVLRYVASLGLAGLAFFIVTGKTDELGGATGYLEDLRWYWLLVAAVAETGSIVAFAALQRRLLAAGGVEIGVVPLTAITFAGNAIENSLPAGPVWSAVFAFRQFRHRGADDMLAGWTLVAATAISQIALVILAGVGLAAAGSTGSALDLVGVILVMLVLVGVVVLLWTRRRALIRHLAKPLSLFQRLFHRLEGDPHQIIEDALKRMAAVTPSRADWVAALGMAMANWLLDVACLVVAFLAVGADVPWRALLLAYAAAQLAANLPITPGGLGVVEGSLTIALVAYGGGRDSTVAAVLLYRLISFWALLPVGWTSWGLVTWHLRRQERRRQPMVGAPPTSRPRRPARRAHTAEATP